MEKGMDYVVPGAAALARRCQGDPAVDKDLTGIAVQRRHDADRGYAPGASSAPHRHNAIRLSMC